MTKMKHIAAIACLALAMLLPACRERTPQEKVLDCLNEYLEQQALGNFDKSYRLLAPSVRKTVDEAKWIDRNINNINAVRLMKNPSLKNIVITGDRAEGILEYTGVMPDKLSEAVGGVYSNNLTLPKPLLLNEIEKYVFAHWDELSSPMTMPVVFEREGGDWKIVVK